MIALRADLKVVLAAQPVDFRKSLHTLSALVSEALRANPYCGDVFVFRSSIASGLMGLLSNGDKPKQLDLDLQVSGLVYRAGHVPLGRWLWRSRSFGWWRLGRTPLQTLRRPPRTSSSGASRDLGKDHDPATAATRSH
ncbi:IS66 family insertion sequence element accessory protein TnpB [Bradyrhizobium sp. Ash2021]|uniref:IS66 family insertion sequence element accessory protein TnpB n=1 Tax=Bradyrhizobium sp. Ash2021 TaxID=2954771 RepID=UPI002814ABB2|nr:IS66 family insertion sequence element accessory protein TnpB [Bradyrhizobium sp. Ash2021]WMT78210.1 IS66 family insertion sequence element accessory protein TnpB [Bradyrhizobium sp. Ash2021]